MPIKPKRFRWLRRIVLGFALLGLLLAAAGWLAFRNLTPLALWAAGRFLPEWRIDAKTLRIERDGGLMLSDVRVRLRKDGSEVLSLDQATVAFTWPGLRERRIRAVEVERLRLSVNDDALEEARRLVPANGSPDGKWTIDRIALRNGHVKAALGTQPAFEGRIDSEIFSLGPAAREPKPDSVRLRNVTLRSPAGRDIVTIPEASLTFTPAELGNGHVRSLIVQRPTLALTQEEAALLNSGSRPGAPAKRWKVDELSINEADVRVDFPALPRIAATIDVRAADLDSEPNERATPGQVRVANLSIQPRDAAAKPATLESATIDFTSSGLASGRLREVRLVRPSVSFGDAWKSVLSGFSGGALAAPGPRLVVERVSVEGGTADVLLPGVPAVRGSIAAELRDVGGTTPGVQTIELRDLRIGLPDQPAGVFREWLTLPSVKVTFDIAELRDHQRVKSIELDRPVLRFDRETRAMFSKVGDASPSPANAIVVETVRLRDAEVSLDDLGLGIPPQKFTLNLNLTNVPLNDPLSADAPEVQTLELSNINFVSPLDPFVPVLVLPSIFIQWTPAGLRERQIEEVKLVGPAIHIGPDLFWYMDLVDRQRAAAGAPGPVAAPGPSWRVKRFEATSGRLVLAMAGQSRLTLPMPFESHAENLDFQRLSDLRLSLVLEVPEQDYDNNALDIHLGGVSGKIDFKLPPGEDADNVVHTLKVRDIRWKEFRGSDWWLGLTFDEQGIHGDGGGRMCSGDIRAGFTFFLDERTPWTGWLSGSRLDLKEITDKLLPGRASMTGRATATLAVNGTGGELTRVAGDFRVPGGGGLSLTKIDDIIAAIPPDWENAKRDLVLIGLRTLRDYPYTKGNAAFWLTEQTGQLNVRLDGSVGKRELEVNFNPIGDLNRIFMFSPFQP